MRDDKFPKFIIQHFAFIIGSLPAALCDAGELSRGGELAEANPADAELLEDAARAATTTAAGVGPNLEFRGPFLLLNQ
jgi:hypothetical protein